VPAIARGRATAAALALIGVTSLLHVWYAGAVPLAPREAYAWEAARHLDLSYLDHPPLLAWTIRATTAFGASERTVRLAATLHAALAAWFFFLAARRLLGGRAALIALLAALATPLFALGQAAATPDAPLLAGWCAALYFTLRALDGDGRWLLAAGAATGWAALGQYTGWLLAPQILAVLALDRRGRRHLRTPWPWLGLVLALALFSPVLVWNAHRGGASVAYHAAGQAAALGPPSLDRVMRFLVGQALLATPVLGSVLWVAAAAAAVRAREPLHPFCAILAVPAGGVSRAHTPFVAVGASRPPPGDPRPLLAAAAFLAEAPRGRRAIAGIAVVSGLAATTWLHLAPLFPELSFPSRELATAGWRELAARVDAERRKLPGDPFVLGCGADVASALAFYLPGQPTTFSSSAMGESAVQYGEWSPAAALAGREGIVVLDRRDRSRCTRRADFCAPLERLRPLTVRRKGQPVTTFDLWRCRWRAPGSAPGDRTPRSGRRPAAAGTRRSCRGGRARSRSERGRRGRAPAGSR